MIVLPQFEDLTRTALDEWVLDHLRVAVNRGLTGLEARALLVSVQAAPGFCDAAFAATIQRLVERHVIVPKQREGQWFLDITLRAAQWMKDNNTDDPASPARQPCRQR